MHRNYGKYSINQISEALNLSRNTVSKVLNDKPGVSERTRRLILEHIGADQKRCAAEPEAVSNTIMFSYRLENIEYINGLLAGIERVVRERGYLLAINIVDTQGKSRSFFPASVYGGSICGILSFNIYDDAYWREVTSLAIPAVFFDTGSKKYKFIGKADVIATENERSIHEVVSILKREGRSRFGFFGDPCYCGALCQRWTAFQDALEEEGLPFDRDNCILEDLSGETQGQTVERLKAWLSRERKRPDAMICASDRQAIVFLHVLNELSIRVPEEIALVGFDNLPESVRQSPPLSTVDAHSDFQGELAVKKLLERIAWPDKPHECVQCETTLILRESTGHAQR